MNGTWTSTEDNRLRNIGRFSLGAESIALFARVGGGIYTKRLMLELI
jgi:Na+/H+-translocating membrane pyrophosphatase